MTFCNAVLSNIFISLTPAQFEPHAACIPIETLTPLAFFLLIYLQPVLLSWGLRGISSKHPNSHKMFLHPPSTFLGAFSCLQGTHAVSLLLPAWEFQLGMRVCFLSLFLWRFPQITYLLHFSEQILCLNWWQAWCRPKVLPNMVLPTKGYRLDTDGGIKWHVPHQSILRSPSLQYPYSTRGMVSGLSPMGAISLQYNHVNWGSHSSIHFISFWWG